MCYFGLELTGGNGSMDAVREGNSFCSSRLRPPETLVPFF